MAISNWRPITKAPKGIGPLLLRAGPSSLDPALVGYQNPDNGRWFDGENREAHPVYFCLIPEFDCDEAAS